MHFTITGSDMITKIFAKFLSTFMGIYHVGTHINIFFQYSNAYYNIWYVKRADFMNDVAELFKVVGGLNTVTLTSLILKFWSVGWGSINSSYIQLTFLNIFFWQYPKKSGGEHNSFIKIIRVYTFIMFFSHIFILFCYLISV